MTTRSTLWPEWKNKLQIVCASQTKAATRRNVAADCELRLFNSACLWSCTAHEHGRRAGIIVEYLQTSAKTFARNSGSNDVYLGSHLGALEQGYLAGEFRFFIN